MARTEPAPDLNELLAGLLKTAPQIPTDGTAEGAKLHETFTLMAQRLAQLAGATTVPAGFHWTDPGFPRLDMEIHDLAYKLRVLSGQLPPLVFQANFDAVEQLERVAITRQATFVINDLVAASGDLDRSQRGAFVQLVQRLGALAGVPTATAPGPFPTPDVEIAQLKTQLTGFVHGTPNAQQSQALIVVLGGLATEMQQRLQLENAIGQQGAGLA